MLETQPNRLEKPAGKSRWTLFPNGVRLWQFILFPGATMALAIGLSRLTAWWLPDQSPGMEANLHLIRTIGVSLMMAAVITWLALAHRRHFERQLQDRNEALEATRDYLSRIIDGSGEAIVTRDAAGRVTSWNPAAEKIYGWSAEEMFGRRVDVLLPDEPSIVNRAEEIDQSLRGGISIQNYETTRLDKTGRKITVRITRTPLYDAAGQFVGTTGIVRDVTRLKEMESRLVERERLAAVGEMAAQIAHEVRNPLAGIGGACDLMLRGTIEQSTRGELADEVRRQIRRLDRTVEDLLQFARPKRIQPIEANIHDVLGRVVGMLQEDPRADGIDFERQYEASLPEVCVDQEKMEQVFFNLLLNAFQAMGHGGKVVLTTRGDGHGIDVVVGDTGPGIPREISDKIFRPFFTTRTEGNGLGLAIVRNIVEAHGGSVDVDNAPGGGAEFTIHLPRRTAA